MTTTDTFPHLLDVEQVAQMLNASTRHIYRLVDAGQMPRPIKLGTLCRWPKAVIEAWIEGGCQPVQKGTARRKQALQAPQS